MANTVLFIPISQSVRQLTALSLLLSYTASGACFDAVLSRFLFRCQGRARSRLVDCPRTLEPAGK